MTLEQILDRLFVYMRENRLHGSISESNAIKLLNDLLSVIYVKRNWDFLRSTAWMMNFAGIPTTGLSAGSSSVTLTSASNLYRGQFLTITDGTNFDTVRILTRNGNVLTFEPTLINTYAFGISLVAISKNIFLPYDCKGKIDIVRVGSDGVFMIRENQRLKDYNDPVDRSYGKPTYYIQQGNTGDYLTGLTLKTGSTSKIGVIAGASLVDFTANYYRNWRFVNETRKLDAYVTQTVVSGTDMQFLLDRDISGQVSTDTVRLEDSRTMLELNPIPDSSYNFKLEYYKSVLPPLVNTYDSLPRGIPEEWLGKIVQGLISMVKMRDDQGYAIVNNQILSLFLEDQNIGNDEDNSFNLRPYWVTGYNSY